MHHISSGLHEMMHRTQSTVGSQSVLGINSLVTVSFPFMLLAKKGMLFMADVNILDAGKGNPLI